MFVLLGFLKYIYIFFNLLICLLVFFGARVVAC